MNVTIPAELCEVVKALAERERVSVGEIVRRAVVMYVASEKEIEQELEAWETANDEGLREFLDDVEEW